jgi:HlyD family secretion protein
MRRILATAILALACGVAGCRGARESASPTQGEGSTADSQEDVVGLGRIEPASGVIEVGAMMGDRLGRLLVKEGDTVDKGAPLAELESRTLRGLEVDAARLNVEKAEAADLVTAAHRQKIELLKVHLALTRKDQERLKGLSKELATDQERERQALLVQQADSELESAQAALRQMLRANELTLRAAKLDLKRAENQYERTQITAPCKGTILKIYIDPGETIGNKPLLQMADLDQMVVVVEVFENEVKRLSVGQQALVTSKAFRPPCDRDGIHGKVTRIGRMISEPALKSVDPFAPADRHVVEVRVRLDPKGSHRAATLSNLQVDVRFLKRD